MKKFFESEIEIDRPIEEVWKTLIDFESYKEWNPYIEWAEGELKEGKKIRIKVARQPVVFRGKVKSVKPNEELVWDEVVPYLPGIQPRYIRRLEKIDENRTRFIHREEFYGWAVPAYAPFMQIFRLRDMYPETCKALKARVEK